MIEYIKNGESYYVKNTGSTILDSVLNANIEHPYVCKSGVCGQCRCKVKSGKIKIVEEFFYPVENNEVLLCCCKSEDNIVISVD